MSETHYQPAADIIARLGGVSAVAIAIGRDDSTVRRWRMAPPQGTGGVVPYDAMIGLLQYANSVGVSLTWSDFTPRDLEEFVSVKTTGPGR